MNDLYDEVRKVIDEWDPLNYYPDNRYGVETRELIKHVRFSDRPISIESISYYLNYLLNHGMYDPEKSFTKTNEDTLVISERIYYIFNKKKG